MKKNLTVISILLVILVSFLIINNNFKKDIKKEASNDNNIKIEDKSDENKDSQKEPINKREVIYIKSYDELMSKIKNSEKAILVIGRTGCRYCELYLPVLKEINLKYNIEILYLNILEISDEEYNKIMNSEITIPRKCSVNDKESKLSEGFRTPLTLFIKNDKSFGCIKGYKNTTIVKEELKLNQFIK